MQKFILLLTYCILACYCYCQSPVAQDSVHLSTNNSKQKELFSIAVKPSIAIYPNPAEHRITLQVKNFDAGMVAVKLLDTKGKLVREDKRLLTNGTEDIIMFLMLKTGIYFVIVSGPGKAVRRKLLIL